jgi:hypothetical protein
MDLSCSGARAPPETGFEATKDFASCESPAAQPRIRAAGAGGRQVQVTHREDAFIRGAAGLVIVEAES